MIIFSELQSTFQPPCKPTSRYALAEFDLPSSLLCEPNNSTPPVAAPRILENARGAALFSVSLLKRCEPRLRRFVLLLVY